MRSPLHPRLQNPLPGVGAATHKLRGAWGPGPPALDGPAMPLRGSGLRDSLLGEQVGAGESRAGVRDRHGHGAKGEWARGLRSE